MSKTGFVIISVAFPTSGGHQCGPESSQETISRMSASVQGSPIPVKAAVYSITGISPA